MEQIQLSQMIEEDLLRDFAQQPGRLDLWRDHMRQSIVATYTRWIAAEQIASVSVSYPADWWQHFKREVMPKWFRDKFPVKLTTVAHDVKAYYPFISLPDHKPFVRFQKVEFPDTYFFEED